MNERFAHGHAVVVGVGADLPNTVEDAVALAGILGDPARCAYPPEQVHLLTGERATRDAFLCALNTLARSTDSQSTVIVYFSGHGCRVASPIGEACYLVTYGYDLDRLYQTAVSSAEFAARLRAIPAPKLLLLLDCCHAGTFGEAKAPGLELAKSALPPEARQLLAEGAGRVLIASSQEDELSFAGRPYSAFTLALLEAFSGVGVAKAKQDGYVRVGDLAMHTAKVVPFLTNKRQNPILHFEHADNFVLAFYAAGDSAPKGLPFTAEKEIEPKPGAWRMNVDLRGQTAHGPQTVVGGDVRGPALSGEFAGPVAAAGGEAVDARGAQAVYYKSIIQQTPALAILRPPAPRPLPTMTAAFIGREAELADFEEKLATSHLVVICGPPGVGKTALACELARRARKGNLSSAFWYQFGIGEGLEMVIRELAGFLYWHDKKDLWQRLENARRRDHRALPPEESLDHAFQMLRGHGYLLCLDDLHFVEDDRLLDDFDRAIDSAVQAGELDVIITSQCIPSFVDMDRFTALSGLNLDETRDLFAQHGFPSAEAEKKLANIHSTQTLAEMQDLTTAELIVNLHTRTEGNALLLTQALDAFRRTLSPLRLLARLFEVKDIERFLKQEIEDSLTTKEQDVMKAVAVFQGQPGTRDAIETILGGESVWCTLSNLAKRNLLHESEGEAGREYSMNAIVRHFYYNLLSKREREAMHHNAGEYYEIKEPDVLKAAHHFAEAEEYKRAARLVTVTGAVRELISKGQAKPLRRLLDKLVNQELASEQKARIYRARGEFYGFQGERDLARENYEQALSALDTLPDSGSVRELKARVCQDISDLEHHEKNPAQPH